jgi:hypothetical protein
MRQPTSIGQYRPALALWESRSCQTFNAVEWNTVFGWMNEFDLARLKVRVSRCFHTRKFYCKRESFWRVSNELLKSSFEYKPPVSRFEDNRPCGFNKDVVTSADGECIRLDHSSSYCCVSRSQENNE